MIQTSQKLAHEGLGVRNDSKGGRVVAPQFLWVNIDVNQARAREIPGITGLPAGRRTIIKARTDREYEVGEAAGLIGRVRPVAADETQRQRIVTRDTSHAIGRGDDGDPKPVCKCDDFGAGLGERCSVADKEHWAIGLCEQLKRGIDIFSACPRAMRSVEM